MWTKEKVKEVLEGNPNYDVLFNEFSGQYKCIYNINGVHVYAYNEIGGVPKIYFSEEILFMEEDDKLDLQDFVKIANEILKEKAKLENY